METTRGSSFSSDDSQRTVPSFIEPLPPMVPYRYTKKSVKGINLLQMFEEDTDSEELVQVYLRLKPCSEPSNLYEVRSNGCFVTSLDTATAGHGRKTQHSVPRIYNFAHIFEADASQKEIFNHVVKNNLMKLTDGHSYTLLTYGASGSGKTFTHMGTVEQPGLVPRSLEYLFKIIDPMQIPIYKPSEGGVVRLDSKKTQQQNEIALSKKIQQMAAPVRRDKFRRMSVQLSKDFGASTTDLSNRRHYYVWVSFVEIYNEAVYDLLVPRDKLQGSKQSLKIREDTSGNVYIENATEAFVYNAAQAYDVMAAGKRNLQVAATGVHAHSSRSHCIFTITLLTETESEGVSASYVRLCDLAGSERASRTCNTGTRMQESRAINSSLHVLERCLHMLRRKQRVAQDARVPFRESKLTRLLGSALSGSRGEAVSMVVTLNPQAEYVHETRHVLSLAGVAKDIQVNSTIAESVLESTHSTTMASTASQAELMQLRVDNERLHFEVAQLQSQNDELLAQMEEKQQRNARTMQEFVTEAKDMMAQYYKAQIDTLERRHQTEVNELTQEIAILEDKLNAEAMSRARLEMEVQHLRACIDERDREKEEVVNVLDREETDDESDDESLEQTLKSVEKAEALTSSSSESAEAVPSISVDLAEGQELNGDIRTELAKVHQVDEDIIAELGDGYEPVTKTRGHDSIEQALETIENMEAITSTSAEIAEAMPSTSKELAEVHELNEVKTIKLSKCHHGEEVILAELDESHKPNTKTRGYGSEIFCATNVSGSEIFSATNESLCDSTDPSELSHALQTPISSKKGKTNNSELYEEIFEENRILPKYPKEQDEGKLSFKVVENKHYFFDEPDGAMNSSKNKEVTNTSGEYLRSPSIVKDDVPKDYELTTIKKLLGENISKNNDLTLSIKQLTRNESIDVFEEVSTPNEKLYKEVTDIQTAMKRISLNKDISDEIHVHKTDAISTLKKKIQERQLLSPTKQNNSNDAIAKKPPINYCREEFKKKIKSIITSNVDNELDPTFKNKIQTQNPSSKEKRETDTTKFTLADMIKENNKTIKQERLSESAPHNNESTETKNSESEINTISKDTCNNRTCDVAISAAEAKKKSDKIYKLNYSIKDIKQEKSDEEHYRKVEQISEKNTTNDISNNTVNQFDSMFNDISSKTSDFENLVSSTHNNNVLDQSIAISKDNKQEESTLAIGLVLKSQDSVEIHSETENNLELKEKNVHNILHDGSRIDKTNIMEKCKKAEDRKFFKIPDKVVENRMPKYSDASNNTVEQFDRMFNDISTSQSCEFERLLSNSTDNNNADTCISPSKANNFEKPNLISSSELKEKEAQTNTSEPHSKIVSYNNLENVPASQPENILKDMTSTRSDKFKQVITETFDGKKKDRKIDVETHIISNTKDVHLKVQIQTESSMPQDKQRKTRNTVDEFETMFKDDSDVKHVEFDLLVSDSEKIDREAEKATQCEIALETRKSTRKSRKTATTQKKEKNTDPIKQDLIAETDPESPKTVKYNLRQKHQESSENDSVFEEKKILNLGTVETTKRKRNLRQCRLKNQVSEDDEKKEKGKLTDIANLQKEFSDVTLGMAPPLKLVHDIPSPEKKNGEQDENVLPINSTAKSATRSRRKLFTPRAEPLEESPSHSGDSTERVRVPRPSYHKTRARRRL